MDFELIRWIIDEGTGALAVAGVILVIVRIGKTRDALTARADAHEKDCSEYRRTAAATDAKQAEATARIEEHVKAIDKRLEEGNERFARIEGR